MNRFEKAAAPQAGLTLLALPELWVLCFIALVCVGLLLWSARTPTHAEAREISTEHVSSHMDSLTATGPAWNAETQTAMASNLSP